MFKEEPPVKLYVTENIRNVTPSEVESVSHKTINPLETHQVGPMDVFANIHKKESKCCIITKGRFILTKYINTFGKESRNYNKKVYSKG